MDEFKDSLKHAMDVIVTEYGKTAHIVLFGDFTGTILDNNGEFVGEFNDLEDLFAMTLKLERNQQ